MGTPAFNPNASYSVPAFDPSSAYQAEGGQSTSSSSNQDTGYGAGLAAGLEGMWNAVRHPIDTITAMGKQVMAGGSTPYGTPLTAPTGNQQRDQANADAQLQAQDEAAKQGQFLGTHPAYAAGMLTPSVALAAAGEAAPRVLPKALLLGRTPEAAYESALKPSTTLSDAERADLIQTGLQNKLPISKGGLQTLTNRVDELQQAVRNEIAADPTRAINTTPALRNLDNVRAKFANQVTPQPDMAEIDQVQSNFLNNPKLQPQGEGPSPGSLSAADAQAMKQGTYQALGNKAYGEVKGASIEAQKALARGLKDEIATQFPELSNLNAQESKLLDLQPVLERAVNRTANHQLIGIGTPMAISAAKAATGSGSVGLVAGILKSALDDPFVKSRLAISISKGAKIPYAQAAARVAAYSSALGSTASAPQETPGDQTGSE